VLGTHPSEAVNFPSFVHSQAAYILLDQHLIGSMIEPLTVGKPGKPIRAGSDGTLQLESMNQDLDNSV